MIRILVTFYWLYLLTWPNTNVTKSSVRIGLQLVINCLTIICISIPTLPITDLLPTEDGLWETSVWQSRRGLAHNSLEGCCNRLETFVSMKSWPQPEHRSEVVVTFIVGSIEWTVDVGDWDDDASNGQWSLHRPG